MVDIDEKKHARYVIAVIERRINENKEISYEKEKEIQEAIDTFRKENPSIFIENEADKLDMMLGVNNARAISNLVNRQLNRYILMKDKPYFGRIDFENEWGDNAYYFGIETIMENNEIVINDWRSPIANLYYEDVMGKASYDSPSGKIEGNITLKRQYKFENGELKKYVEMGMNVSDELLIDVLEKNDDSVMKNIVTTIQKEQNRAIRYKENNDVLVLGVAGSGKTSIALHRIAYLVYKDSLKYDVNKICFITPNELFYNYIKGVLPELGEDNVVTLTLNDIAKTILKSELYKKKWRIENKLDYLEKIISRKKEMDFDKYYEKLNVFLDNKMKELFSDKLGLKIGNLVFKSELFKELYFDKFSKRTYSERKKFIFEYLKDKVSNEKKVNKNVLVVMNTFLDKLLPEVNYFEIYEEFLKSVSYEGEVVHRGVIGYEHSFLLCYIKIFFKKCNLFSKYNHLLVDEYQDLNIFERVVVDTVFGCNKTLVGDFNQKLFLQEYKDIYDRYSIVELNNAYRSTKQIFDFLQTIVSNKGVNSVNREGKEIEFNLFSKEEEEINYLKEIIKNYGGKSLVIVCKSKKMASKLHLILKKEFNVHLLNPKSKSVIRGCVIGWISVVKGLEFDKVVVYEANSKNYSLDIDRNYFYVACSRAINELVVLSSGDFTRFVGEKYEKNS